LIGVDSEIIGLPERKNEPKIAFKGYQETRSIPQFLGFNFDNQNTIHKKSGTNISFNNY
jgi:hypothetical protein